METRASSGFFADNAKKKTYYVIGNSIEPSADPLATTFVGTPYTRQQLEESLETTPHPTIFKNFEAAYRYLCDLNKEGSNKTFPVLVVKIPAVDAPKKVVAVHTFAPHTNKPTRNK